MFATSPITEVGITWVVFYHLRNWDKFRMYYSLNYILVAGPFKAFKSSPNPFGSTLKLYVDPSSKRI